MKYIFLFFLLFSALVDANDSIIQLLEDNGVVIENPQDATLSFQFTGEELKIRINHMNRVELLKKYVHSDHSSELGRCLQNEIISQYNGSSTDSSSGIYEHCGGLFDPPSGTSSPSATATDVHVLQHKDNVIQAKTLAIFECNKSQANQTLKLPLFTAPQNLLDIIYNLRVPASAYHLEDGLSFVCIGSNNNW